MSNSENRTISDKFMLRLPDGMRDRIKAAAERNNRSMNSEILLALEYWLEADLPYTLPVATAEDAKAFGSADREERFESTDYAYAKEIGRTIEILKIIKDTIEGKK